jgi:hypothetical protein
VEGILGMHHLGGNKLIVTHNYWQICTFAITYSTDPLTKDTVFMIPGLLYRLRSTEPYFPFPLVT